MKNRLEELRKARGLRQEELADALEVSRQTHRLAGKRALQPLHPAGLQDSAVFFPHHRGHFYL